MSFIKDNVLGFFDSSQKVYEIPVYQRAYSWSQENWKTFFEDLIEQIEGDNNYFYGSLLLEVVQKNKLYEIIDGQQRLTTLSIFIRALLNVLNVRDLENPVFDISAKERLYFKSEGKIKLRPVEYDRAFYDALVIDNIDKFEAMTPSQKRMKDAKEYFFRTLSPLTTELLLKIFNKVENTELNVIELPGKKDSALMFELENNRGKDLTNMEKLKSYLMYQIYVFSKPEEVEMNIESIANIFKNVYLLINDISTLSEDSILIYHNNAYLNGYDYRTIEDIKSKFKKSENKVLWIKEYIQELLVTFSNLKKFETAKDDYASRLKEIDFPVYLYPFIIRGYKFLGDSSGSLSKLFHVLEIISFRAKLINSRANIQERLGSILKDFNGDIELLVKSIQFKLNDSWYWGDVNTRNYLQGNMYGNNILNYILWNYENSLLGKGYKITRFTIENEQIEHISPQTPTSGDPIASGYEINSDNQYDEDFIAKYLNSIGNLVLISGSHNASIGNKPFKDKLHSYKLNPLLNQQSEISEFALIENSHYVWKIPSIEIRTKKIVDFACKNWSFSNL